MKPLFKFDIATLFAVEALICFAFVPIFFVIAARMRQLRGPGKIAWAFLCLGAGILVLLLRGAMPLAINVFAGNALMMAMNILFYMGVAGLLGIRPRLRLPLTSAVATLLALMYFTIARNRIDFRIAVMAANCCLIQLNLLQDLIRYRSRHLPTRLLSVTVMFSMFMEVLRGAVAVLHGVPGGLLQYNYFQAVYFLSCILCICGWGIFNLMIIAGEITTSIERSARRDTLTGALNRLGIEELLAVEVERSRRTRVPLSVALLDIDHFKAFNDTGGHAAGDDVLRNVVNAVAHHLRAFDACGRIGGDEFLIMLPGSTALDITAVCSRILREVAALPAHAASGITPTVSIGFTEVDIYDTVVDVLARADHALYATKHNGRNCAQMELAPLRTEPIEAPTAPKAVRRSRMRRAASSMRDFRS